MVIGCRSPNIKEMLILLADFNYSNTLNPKITLTDSPDDRNIFNNFKKVFFSFLTLNI